MKRANPSSDPNVKRPKTDPEIGNDDDIEITGMKSIGSGSAGCSYKLTTISDLPAADNLDTVSISDILGVPDIKKMVQFNFSISVSYVMDQLAPSMRGNVDALFIHGGSRKDLEHERLAEEAKLYGPRVKVDNVYLQSPFGTHHSKIMVLFYGDNSDQCEVIIHTANLIAHDWENTTQGVWRSGRLQKASDNHEKSKFQTDFIEYLQSYKVSSLRPLINQLADYDFSSIKSTLIASTPGRFYKDKPDFFKWGANKLRNALTAYDKGSDDDQLIMQCSSVGTLGDKDNYLTPILKTAMLGKEPMAMSQDSCSLKLVYPSVDDVRNSINGYISGGSIFMKKQKPKDLQQLQYIRPMLCRWKGEKTRRGRAAPHIKTYTRVSKNNQKIRWFLLTSANLSKQAWGSLHQKNSYQWIQSFECGILLTGDLKPGYLPTQKGTEDHSECCSTSLIRLPYDLPVEPYTSTDEPWTPWQEYTEPDLYGNCWP